MSVKPFIKWAGGKTQLIPQLEKHLPENMDRFDTYVEPFIGGGALFYHMAAKHNFKKLVINDFNPDLVNVYRVIQKQPKKLLTVLEEFQKDYLSKSEDERKEFYYSMREQFNNVKTGVSYDVKVLNTEHVLLAGLFILLNKTCFNGLYRVNSKGLFNVPFANPKTLFIVDEENIMAVSKLLQKAVILCGDYRNVEPYLDGKTFIYLDPPYRPVAASDRGNIYVKDAFNDEAQAELASWCGKMDSKGVKFMLSNSDPTMADPEDKFFEELFKDFNIHTVYAKRMINRDGSARGQIREILVTNY